MVKLIQFLTDAKCPACEIRKPAPALCEVCRAFPVLEGPLCLGCYNPITQSGTLCGMCLKKTWAPLSRIRSAIWLNEPLKNLIHGIKYEMRYRRLDLFRSVLPESSPFSDTGALIPVPLSPGRMKQRAFNQSEWIANQLGKRWGVRVIRNGLIKGKETEPQSTLSRKGRLKNLRSCFRWESKERPPDSVVLVDDVFTSGATLIECGRALRKAGCRQIFGWTLLRTPRSSSRGAQRRGDP